MLEGLIPVAPAAGGGPAMAVAPAVDSGFAGLLAAALPGAVAEPALALPALTAVPIPVVVPVLVPLLPAAPALPTADRVRVKDAEGTTEGETLVADPTNEVPVNAASIEVAVPISATPPRSPLAALVPSPAALLLPLKAALRPAAAIEDEPLPVSSDGRVPVAIVPPLPIALPMLVESTTVTAPVIAAASGDAGASLVAAAALAPLMVLGPVGQAGRHPAVPRSPSAGPVDALPIETTAAPAAPAAPLPKIAMPLPAGGDVALLAAPFAVPAPATAAAVFAPLAAPPASPVVTPAIGPASRRESRARPGTDLPDMAGPSRLPGAPAMAPDRAGSAPASASAQPASAASRAADPALAMTIATAALGDVRIGLDGGPNDLRVSLGLAPGGAALVAADAARLAGDLAASGIRLQSLDVGSGGANSGDSRPRNAPAWPIAARVFAADAPEHAPAADRYA